MNLFDQHDSFRNSHESITDTENNKNFIYIVTLTSLLNKVFYSPVSFLIEYVKNDNLQLLVEQHTGYNRYNFITQFIRNFPNVSKSRRLKKVIDNNK